MSFKRHAELSLIPGLSRKHSSHIIKPESSSGIPILKTAVIYGANASGKSNFIKAMKHAQNLIVEGAKAGRKLPYFPFALSPESKKEASSFEFEIKVGEKYYAYGFSNNDNYISEEWLYRVNKRTEECIFERYLQGEGDSQISFPNIKFKNKKDRMYFDFTAKGTPGNRLFLTECYERNITQEIEYIDSIKDVIDWFHEKLNIIFPSSKYSGLEMDMKTDEVAADRFTKILNSFDTGIKELKLIEINFDKDLKEIPKNIYESIDEDLKDNETVILAGSNNNRFSITRNDKGEICAYKIMSAHEGSDGNEVLFEINQESDGTQRLIDIVAGLVDIFSEEKVYVIDEIDRSLHPEITSSIVRSFLKNTCDIKSQMMFTTHESNLLDQSLLRKDEIWFSQKNRRSESEIYSLQEFKPRFDKDVRKGYLMGRFGGVPVMPNCDELSLVEE